MTGPLIAEKIKISAFRGITQPLELDFTAPVTLVYAPNGTGKTTFCEAVEWLLTGQVERLREGSSWSDEILQSAFLDGVAPQVEASLRIGEDAHQVWRTPEGAWIDHHNGSPWRAGDILEMFAPTAAAPNKHHKSAISLRQHYLRGTRFLTTEALAALVDNTPGSLDRRKDVFADLLGIRHLRDAEQDSEKYVNELATFLRILDSRRSALSAEAEQLRAELKNAASGARSADGSLSAAERLLGLAPSGLDIPGRIEAAVGAIAKRRSEETLKSEALDALAPVWSRKAELDAQIIELRPIESEAAKAVEAAQNERRQAQELVRDREKAVQTASGQVGRLEAAEDALRAALESMLHAALLASPYLSDVTPTLANLVTSAPEMRWDATARQAKRVQLRDAVNAEPRVDRLIAEQTRLAEQRATVAGQLASTQQMDLLRSEADERDAAATRARSDAEALAGPVATLQSAGQAVVVHQHDEDAECPLCGHDWSERRKLLEAIQRTLNAAPAIVAAARTAADSAAAAARAARAAVTDAVRRQTQVEALDKQARDVQASLESDRSILGAMEAPLSGPERRRVLDWAERRLNLADALAALSAAQTDQLSIVSADGARFLDAAAPISSLRERLDQTIATRRAGLSGVAHAARGALEVAQTATNEKVAAEAAKQSALESIRSDQAAAETEREAILGLWTKAAGEQSWTADGLERLRGDVASAVKNLDRAENEVAAARASWAVEAKHARLATVEADLAPLNAKHARLKASSDVAQRLQASFRDSYISTSRAQVGGLSRVVNGLFLRMHANRIVDRIDLGQSESFLHWFADAGDAQLDPGRDFSQGQRQDLALALFLARARGLGGTFFLDEPVAHLDDLNRVGLMDVFRAVATEGSGRIRLVITTASRSLARHMVEKFGAVAPDSTKEPTMRVIELTGNGRLGVRQQQVYPLGT
ncbi:AAA family ATPase [Mesorhizobium sp. CA6]|uniref:ATP-binding protein n=1 Tax=Mesorhizobium sp. CA6 TaxID=588500 RepID=UPI001CCB3405|nr:ATP-binding protein [Mesorhizobium sp. CA6]MBZ9765516.1 AAA family ATPase [Mesorhizobium sp. CA6]